MSDDFERTPEERGSLQPPGRRPPTAVGLAGRRPPPRPRRSLWRLTPDSRALRLLYASGVASLVVGGGIVWMSLSVFMNAVGYAVVFVGFLVLIPLMWIQLGFASRWSLWRKRRWILRRQRELSRPTRPSA